VVDRDCAGIFFSQRTAAQTNDGDAVGHSDGQKRRSGGRRERDCAHTQTNLTRTVDSTEQGEYRSEFLPVGTYDLEVTGKGFKKAVLHGIVLQVSVTSRVDAQLEIAT